MQFSAIVKHGYMKQMMNVFGNVIVAKTFRVHRKNETTKLGGVVMLLVPTSLRPKVKKDFNYKHTKKIESVWVECKLMYNNHNGGIEFKNVSYNPNKTLTGELLEGMSSNIDYVVVKNKPLTLMGDKNINNLNRKERKGSVGIDIW